MGRSPCCDKNGLKKGPWTPEEDKKLIDHIQKNGHGSWRTLPKNAGLQRCGKSCRLRWANYLRPDIKRGKFSLEEEETIIQLHSVLGNKWSTIAARLPGRTDNEIKNYWNTHIKKKLLKMGIDPVTHTPRLDLFDLSAMFRSSFINQSHQLTNISRLLALQSLVNPNLTKLLTTLVSSRLEKLEHLPQNMQENNPFSNFQPNQIQETSFPTPYVKIENNQTIPQFPCNVHQESNLNTMNFNSQEKLFQENAILPSNMMENLGQELNQEHGWSNIDKFFMNPLLENSNFQASDYTNKNFDFDSIISTPSSSQTPLNSSTNITSSIEDDRDSYCSDLLKFEFSDLLDLNGFM